MKSASIPANELARLAALQRYAVLDTPAESPFDDCTRLAAQLCNVPAALISLIDGDRQWFKSRFGFELPQTPRAISFCAHAILGTTPFIVPDALLDERFCDNPLVTAAPKIRFYAAAPLVTPDGFCIGTLCVLDHRPHQLTAAQQESLTALGRQVVCQLELRRRQNTEAAAAPAPRARKRSKRATRSRQSVPFDFEQLLETLPQIVWCSNIDGETTYLNQRFYEYTGFKESTSKTLRQILHPEDYDQVMEGWAKAQHSTTMYTKELRMKRASDGAYRWFLSRAVPGCKPGEWFGTSTDIHELKLAEAALRERELSLRESDQRYARAVRGTSDGLWEWNILTDEAYLSPRWKELLGFTEDELPNHRSSFISRVHPDDLQRIRAALQIHLTQRTPYDLEVRLRTRSGAYRWFRSRGQADLNEQGQAVRMAGSIRDITDVKDVELALRLRDRAIQSVSQGIIITDATLPDNPIIYVSPAFERLTGYSSAEVLMRNCRFLQGKDTDPAVVAVVRDAISEGRPCSVELLNYRKDQTPFWNALSLAPIRSGDRVTHFVGIQTDITARRKLEDQFHQAQKMEAIGRLAGGIAHDFNNLLTIINGYSDMLLAELGGSQLTQRSEVEEIREAGRRAAELTAQLLALSRKTMVKPKVLELNTVIQSRAQMFGRMFADDIAVVLNLAPKLSRIKVDPGQLEQVIINLVINARDAMPKGGQLTITTRDIELLTQDTLGYHDYRPGRYVQLLVADTGCGMSDEVKAKLFEPFFTTKEPGKGTGLGLATVYGIVQQASCYISVQSQLHLGTTFTILFPAVSAPLARAAKAPAPPLQGGAETILLVDDEEAVRKLARLVLEAQGYVVLAASSGAEALQVIERHPGTLHLLLTDVVMPALSGRELAAALRSKRPELKVVYMSGFTDDSVVRSRMSEAANSFLPKPFAPFDLVKKIRAVLDDPTPSSRLSAT